MHVMECAMVFSLHEFYNVFLFNACTQTVIMTIYLSCYNNCYLPAYTGVVRNV